MMAEVLGTSRPTLSRWLRRQSHPLASPARLGRPTVIAEAARERIRTCYLDHYRQWGPQVLAAWCRREGLGKWCASTLAEVIADLSEERKDEPAPIRYEITASGVMWSEDGAGFRERGRRKELLIAQDEHARFKVSHRLVSGPADGTDVVAYLEEAFQRYGPPLVLKHDGGSIFHLESMHKLLQRYRVVELTGPRAWPRYNGKKERSIRDVRSYERALRRSGVKGTLEQRLDATVNDLNFQRPRPVLGGRTAHEALVEDRITLPKRQEFRKEVEIAAARRQLRARSRWELKEARRRAVEEVLSAYGLMKEIGDVSRNYQHQMRTT
jgi:hypothetical protein